MSNLISTPKASPKATPPTQDSSAVIPTSAKTALQDRWLTVGLYPEFQPKKPRIRLHGMWLEEAGFTPQTRVRVRVMPGCLVITAE